VRARLEQLFLFLNPGRLFSPHPLPLLLILLLLLNPNAPTGPEYE